MSEVAAANPLRNPNDPLRKSGPTAEQELFKAFGQVSHGFPHETVLGAAINVVMNAVRQSQSKRSGAEKAFDEIVGKAKHVLLENHYDNAGNRRNIFPFAQNIQVNELFKNSPKF